jgi:hypothetical protein
MYIKLFSLELERIAGIVCIQRHVPVGSVARLSLSTAVYGDSSTFLYVSDVRTIQETLVGLRGLLKDSFTLLYVLTSQETLMGLRVLLRGQVYLFTFTVIS